jgi:hypothetical protein
MVKELSHRNICPYPTPRMVRSVAQANGQARPLTGRPLAPTELVAHAGEEVAVVVLVVKEEEEAVGMEWID